MKKKIVKLEKLNYKSLLRACMKINSVEKFVIRKDLFEDAKKLCDASYREYLGKMVCHSGQFGMFVEIGDVEMAELRSY